MNDSMFLFGLAFEGKGKEWVDEEDELKQKFGSENQLA